MVVSRPRCRRSRPPAWAPPDQEQKQEHAQASEKGPRQQEQAQTESPAREKGPRQREQAQTESPVREQEQQEREPGHKQHEQEGREHEPPPPPPAKISLAAGSGSASAPPGCPGMGFWVTPRPMPGKIVSMKTTLGVVTILLISGM